MVVHSPLEVRDNMSNMSIMFRTTVGLFVDASSSRITYNEFLAQLKTAYSAVVLNPNLFGIHMPVMFRTTVGLFVDASFSRNPDNEFLAELQTVCPVVGLDPNLFGTFSMRRGSIIDQFSHGIMDKLMNLSGR